MDPAARAGDAHEHGAAWIAIRQPSSVYFPRVMGGRVRTDATRRTRTSAVRSPVFLCTEQTSISERRRETACTIAIVAVDEKEVV